jgi:hypothetical protein
MQASAEKQQDTEQEILDGGNANKNNLGANHGLRCIKNFHRQTTAQPKHKCASKNNYSIRIVTITHNQGNYSAIAKLMRLKILQGLKTKVKLFQKIINRTRGDFNK